MEIDSPSAHTCAAPSVERWRVFEPMSGSWSWLTVFRCCSQVFVELGDEESADEAMPIAKAA